MERTLRSGFLASAAQFPERDAVVIGQARLSYRALEQRARRIAATLDRYAPRGEGRLTAVFGHRHPTTFAGIVGALMRGHGYVPLNPMYPSARTRAMLERSGCHALVVDPTALGQLEAVLDGVPARRVVLLPDVDEVSNLRTRWSDHIVLGAADLASSDEFSLGYASENDIAYLLFTSGSTGEPKGVMVAHRNVVPVIDFATARYGIRETDRLSNTFDLTFDLSVFDLFCAWERGACVFVPTPEQKMFPAKYIRQHSLTIWFSVPSTGVLMSRLRMLSPGAYETLRWVLFCGEALPADIVERFLEAAPKARVENLYGPTELTIACTVYRWDPLHSRNECERGLVPIGEPFPGMQARVVDESLRPVPPGEPGELLMAGPQMTPGYWLDPRRTGQVFVVPPGESLVYYRTGDLVRWPKDGPMRYLGRIDNQVKVQGYRVELGEVEAVIREVAGVELAVAVGWPRNASGVDGIVGFVGTASIDAETILEQVRSRLPAYMQPSEIRIVSTFPLNPNGKIDRQALVRELEREKAA